MVAKPRLDLVNAPLLPFNSKHKSYDLASGCRQLASIALEKLVHNCGRGPLVASKPRVVLNQPVAKGRRLANQIRVLVGCRLPGTSEGGLDKTAIKDAIVFFFQMAHHEDVNQYSIGVGEVAC